MEQKNKGKLLGFRSGKIFKKIASIFYLFMCAMVLIAGLSIARVGQITMMDYIIDKLVYVIITLWMLSPYLFLSNTKIREKLPLFKEHKTKSSALGMGIVSVFFIVLLVIVFVLHSPEYKADMKNHDYKAETSTAATCESDGSIHYVCDYCGTASDEEVSALGHKMVEFSRKEATYTENGEIVTRCELCGKEEITVLEKLVSSEAVSETESEETSEILNSDSIEPHESDFESKIESDVVSENSSVVSEETDTPEESNPDADNNTEEELSCFQALTDEQFGLLTEMVAKSFYTFKLEDDDYKAISNDNDINECLKKIYDYAYANYFELEPQYKIAVSERYEVVSNISNYKELQNNFILECYRDNEKGEWIFNISSYTINPTDTYEGDGKLYIDAEGYLNPGVILYFEEDGQFIKVGEIEEVAYKKQIDNTVYGYAIKIKYYDDPYSSGWYDGEQMLTFNKKYGGSPILYVDALDVNRNVAREEIDYGSGVDWKALTYDNAKTGTKVYSGLLNAKSYMFTIVSADKSTDIMLVEYSSGSVEIKSFSAMVNLGYLYIK